MAAALHLSRLCAAHRLEACSVEEGDDEEAVLQERAALLRRGSPPRDQPALQVDEKMPRQRPVLSPQTVAAVSTGCAARSRL